MAATLNGNIKTLAIIENLQAAETICDRYPRVAVLWSAGQPSDAALKLCTTLAERAEHVLIATDADLGGVRITQRITKELPGTATILDPGTEQHSPRAPFGPVSQQGLYDAAKADGPAAELARACLNRGYPVEQEASIRASLEKGLRSVIQ